MSIDHSELRGVGGKSPRDVESLSRVDTTANRSARLRVASGRRLRNLIILANVGIWILIALVIRALFF